MTQDNVLRLLVVEKTLEDAEYLVSTLRNAGIAARPTRAETVEELESALEERALDAIVCAVPGGELSVAEVAQAVGRSGKDVPVVAYAQAPDAPLMEEVIGQGATDIIYHDLPEHLHAVLRRELDNVNARRALRVAESSLKESEKHCQSLLNNAQEAIAYVHEGMHVYANRNYLKRFGYADFDEIAGTPLLDMIGSRDHQQLKDCLIRFAKGEDVPESLELEGNRADGTPMPLTMEFSVANYDDEPCTQIVIREHVAEAEPEETQQPEAEPTEQIDLEKEIDNLRAQDMVTGLYNRIFFIEELERTIASVAGGNDSGAVLYVELDSFRSIVDQVGHKGADALIVDVARLLEDRQGQADIAARFGDFSFTVLCPERSLRNAEELGEEIRRAIEGYLSEGSKHAVTVTASVGIAPVTEQTTDVQDVLANATAAAAQANAQGGNRVEIYTPAELAEAGPDGARWSSLLQEALDEDRFFLVFQPLVSLHGQGGEYYEALLRLHGENDEEIPASEFIVAAEEYGMMKQIDRWVFRTAASIIGRERGAGKQTRLFLKISAQSMADESLIPWMKKLIEKAGINGESLVFEFPESKAVTNLKTARTFVRALKDMKCGFVLEQFGSGINSFQILKHLPAGYLKIDRSFSKELANDDENRAKVKEITDEGHSQGKLIIAEFVEDAASMSVLYQIGVNYVQGNFLQEPEKMLSYDFS